MIEALGEFWGGIVGAFAEALAWLHSGFATFVDPANMAWGLAIIGLTLIIRLLLMPLAVKQIRSMRAMQELQPKIKEIQDKYDTDRELLKKDPERYQKQRQKMQEELMSVYSDAGVNPAMGCLPLLAQLPVFIALFDVLQSENISVIEGMQDATFLFLPGLGTTTSAAGWAGWLMLGLVVGTMMLAQRQMMASRGGGASGMQQKAMMYGMPVFLAFVAQRLPLGVLVYWVTTNIFQFGQQAIIMREVGDEDEDEDSSGGGGAAGESKSGGTSDGEPTGKSDGERGSESGKAPGGGGGRAESGSDNGKAADEDRGGDEGRSGRRGHIPSRRS